MIGYDILYQQLEYLHVISETGADPDAIVRHPVKTSHKFSVQSHRS